MTATVMPTRQGRRIIDTVLRDVPPKDILLAMRVDDGDYEADMPISGLIRAEIGPDGKLQMADGRIVGGAGFIGSHDAAGRMLIDEPRSASIGTRRAGPWCCRSSWIRAPTG